MSEFTQKYVMVDADTHEIWVNQFGGDLPPMTKQEILHYFWNKTWEQIQSELGIKFYPVDKKHECPHCGAPLCESETDGYKWQCFYCDEDFCDFENRENLVIGILEEIQSICIGADSPDAQERTQSDPKTELENCQKDLSAISNLAEKILYTIGA